MYVYHLGYDFFFPSKSVLFGWYLRILSIHLDFGQPSRLVRTAGAATSSREDLAHPRCVELPVRVLQSTQACYFYSGFPQSKYPSYPLLNSAELCQCPEAAATLRTEFRCSSVERAAELRFSVMTGTGSFVSLEPLAERKCSGIAFFLISQELCLSMDLSPPGQLIYRIHTQPLRIKAIDL